MDQHVVQLAKDLIERPSITPYDEGCMHQISTLLKAAGFHCTDLNFEQVTNLWATHGTQNEPTLCLVGHTDVVPTGDESYWLHPPFEATQVDDALYGRGACDMKGSLAAMVVSAIQFVKDNPEHRGRLALLLTSDEEGEALHGTRRVVEWLKEQRENIDYCLVGEPSSDQRLGDIIKIGRRGSLTGKIVITGIQGHVAYPQLATNPIHQAFEIFGDLIRKSWDQGHPDFPPTSLVFSNIKSGTGADNVIPGKLEATFNFRYNPATTVDTLQTQFEAALLRAGLDFEIQWRHSGEPFITRRESPLVEAVQASLATHLNRRAELSTVGGTSDGRFVATMGADVVELGPINQTIHQVNEWVSVQSLVDLTKIYYDVYRRMLVRA